MLKCNENAANRYSYIGEVYSIGENKRKKDISFSPLPPFPSFFFIVFLPFVILYFYQKKPKSFLCEWLRLIRYKLS